MLAACRLVLRPGVWPGARLLSSQAEAVEALAHLGEEDRLDRNRVREEDRMSVSPNGKTGLFNK